MPERDERIDRLEKEFSSFHSDLKYIGRSVDKMATAMESLASMQSDFRVMDERAETRHSAQKVANDLLHSRIDHCSERAKGIELDAYKGSVAHKILLGIGKTLGALAITTVFGLIIWALKAQG
jgi:hypothetical protein